MSVPAPLVLVDDSRRFRVQLRSRTRAALGPYEFDADGRADVGGGGELRRFVEALRPDIESVTEIQDQQASAADTSPVVAAPAAPAVSPDDATPVSSSLDDRADRVRALRAEGRSWQQIGDQLGISRERARQLGRDARELAAPIGTIGPPLP